MKEKIILEKEDCYYDLDEFYSKVAQKMKVDISPETLFDCREICVTKTVQDELWKYQREVKGLDNQAIAALFLCMGPKANLSEQKGKPYAAEVTDGFLSKIKVSKHGII